MTVDKELLFKPRLAEEDVEVPGLGSVRVRALTRDEMMEVRDRFTDDGDVSDVGGMDNAFIALALVDPELTEDEVARWAGAAPAGELAVVAEAVRRVSAMDDAAFPNGVRPNRRGRRAAVRARPGRKAR